MTGGAVDLLQLLTTATERASASFESIREDAASPEEVALTARQVTDAVRNRMEATDTPASISGSPLSRRMLGLVRREFVRLIETQPPTDAAQLIRILAAFERLSTELEPAWDQRFTDRLSGPDGLELVVEVAHDLRSPLTSILFLAETLNRGRSGPITPLQERQLGLIYSAAFGLSSVASDVIELARGGDRLVDLEPLPFSVADIIESVRDIVQPIAEEKGLEVRVTSPAASSRQGHPVALSRVLLNLTTNALKFTDEGFVEIRVTETASGALEFSVRDSGRGIPASAMATLFEPFRRRQKDRDYAFSGSGLGLSICRKLVEAMYGELKVETGSTGTRFFFVLDLPKIDAELGLIG